ncbi:MAG: hypothetical protein WEB29_04980 [Chloroflexota bacterium]
MRSDEEIERLLDDWLTDDAQPMPREVLENALESVARTPQGGTRRTGRSWLGSGPVGVLAAAAVLILVVVAGGLTVNRIGSLFPTASADARPELAWDPGAEFLVAPSQRNPSPDSYGNSNVWSYLSSPRAHAPLQYEPLPTFANGQWTDPSTVIVYRDKDGLVMHPWKADGSVRFAILGWTSPVAGDVTIRGFVLMVDRNCKELGSGIGFSVDRESSTLFASEVRSGDSDHLDVTTTVRRGESIYFIVDPGVDNTCDSTLLGLAITTGD